MSANTSSTSARATQLTWASRQRLQMQMQMLCADASDTNGTSASPQL